MNRWSLRIFGRRSAAIRPGSDGARAGVTVRHGRRTRVPLRRRSRPVYASGPARAAAASSRASAGTRSTPCRPHRQLGAGVEQHLGRHLVAHDGLVLGQHPVLEGRWSRSSPAMSSVRPMHQNVRHVASSTGLAAIHSWRRRPSGYGRRCRRCTASACGSCWRRAWRCRHARRGRRAGRSRTELALGGRTLGIGGTGSSAGPGCRRARRRSGPGRRSSRPAGAQRPATCTARRSGPSSRGRTGPGAPGPRVGTDESRRTHTSPCSTTASKASTAHVPGSARRAATGCRRSDRRRRTPTRGTHSAGSRRRRLRRRGGSSDGGSGRRGRPRAPRVPTGPVAGAVPIRAGDHQVTAEQPCAHGSGQVRRRAHRVPVVGERGPQPGGPPVARGAGSSPISCARPGGPVPPGRMAVIAPAGGPRRRPGSGRRCPAAGRSSATNHPADRSRQPAHHAGTSASTASQRPPRTHPTGTSWRSAVMVS